MSNNSFVRRHFEVYFSTKMNTYEYYLSTCKYVLLADPANRSSWVDLYSYLPCLRQMLSCCVCGNIMLRPKGPGHGICLHHVCSSCIGGKMRLRPVCSWCRTHQGFEENRGLRILILCFKKMCVFINSSSIGEQIRKAASSSKGSQTNTLIRVLDEAVAFEDDYVISNKVMPTCVPTYGMAPEPKLVSFPRGPQGHVSGHRPRSDSALSVSVSVHNDDSPLLCSLQSEKDTEKRQAPSSSGSVDELDKMPALLAPCTHQGIITPEKLSPPLAGPQRVDVHDQQDQWSHMTRHGHYGPKVEGPQNSGENLQESSDTLQGSAQATSPDRELVATETQELGAKIPETKLKRGFASPGSKLKVASSGKCRRKRASKQQEMDFEPPCKRTRQASSLTGAGSGAWQASRKVCFCAYLNPPSRLTCCGQRCPCFTSQLPCVGCMCRGCRNPCVREPATLRRNGDKWDSELEPPMPVLSPEPNL